MITSFLKRHRWQSLLPAVCLLILAQSAVAQPELRVCADPDNLPFSNRKQEGFENKIAALLAEQLHAKLRYTWQRQRNGFIRQTLGAERCDLVMGVPHGYERVLPTEPYYWSGYVFVTARNRHLNITSFDDPLLKQLKIGLHGFGNDGSNSPPASALALRGITDNIVGYSLWGNGSAKNPQGKIIDAVAKGEIDVAVVWGPIAGYYAKPYGQRLEIAFAPHDAKLPDMPFDYEISMGVRKQDQAFAAKLDGILEQQHYKIHDILTAYHVPLIAPMIGQVAADTHK
ncbi:substrate-binding domain-containing protein [Methylomonas sp. MK1]|uniref:substrate-binding domain-containing protein n=1 Tax=Methylomonas sp. MK1 TaxID=1131552 RepID=UPI000367FC1D|nr:substrate-binding domain-containing protein [Methylomonas sp. MK1]